MNSILNLKTTWTIGNFLNNIEHNFSSTIAKWHDSLNEDGQNALIMMKTPAATFKNLRKEIETEFMRDNLILKKKLENGKERLIT